MLFVLYHHVLRDAVGGLPKVAELHLEHQGAPPETVAGEARLEFIGQEFQFGEHVVQSGKVADVSALAPHRLSHPFRDHRPGVDATGEIVEHPAHLSKLCRELLQCKSTQLLAGVDTQPVHVLRRLLSYAPQLLHLQVVDELDGPLRMHGAEAVGFAEVAGHLGQKLAVAHPGRCRESCHLLDSLLYLAGHIHCHVHPPLVVGHVEVCLVKTQRLDDVGILMKDSVHLTRHLLVAAEMRLHHHQTWTETVGHGDGQRRVHPILARHIVGRGNDTPGPVVAHHHGFSFQRGIVEFLHRNEEGVHVDMDDFMNHGAVRTLAL